MKFQIHSISYENNSGQYLDIDVHHGENYIELSIDSEKGFSIETVDELTIIYNKLKELLEAIHNEKETNERTKISRT